MTGRPINADRQNAIDLGLKTYIGAKHYKCGTTVRYVSGGGCVHCARVIANEQREARKFLKQQQAEYLESLDETDRAEIFNDAALDNTEPLVLEDDAEARRRASIDELM